MTETDPAVQAYLDGFDGEVLARLEQVRAIVAEEAPDAVEGLAYGLIGWKLNKKPLIYTGGFAKHVGLYATPEGHEEFAEELSRYKQGKGSVQLPLTEPLPEDLIHRIVAFRVRSLSG
ncbi:iron chaperone [Nocardioides dilutus]